MNLVYYAHSYRQPDTPVVEFFSELMQSEQLIASLDPPSDRLNSAKPERHLRSTDGMVAILTTRGGRVSQYILYEISLALRSNKPLLVFVEDLLPSRLIPSWVLQRRFSRRGLLRQVREHRHALTVLKSYIGSDPPPTYQPGSDQRSCMITGGAILQSPVLQEIDDYLVSLGYAPRVLTGELDYLYDQRLHETLKNADLAIAFIDSHAESTDFVLGSMRGRLTPTILLTANRDYHFHESIPVEYQARLVDTRDSQQLQSVIGREISIFEEEYVDLADTDKVARYAQLLISQGGRPAEYSTEGRNVFVKELFMGDKNINYGTAGAMGSHATGTVNVYQSAWKGMTDVDTNALAAELARLRAALREKASTVEEDKAVVAVGEAETEAQKGNGPGVVQNLASLGKWVLDVAKEIGVEVAAKVISASMGIGG